MALFATVVDAGSFAKAASALGVTRGAVSRQIAALEEDLGARLLERTTRSLGLTEAGAAFVIGCREVSAAAERAVEQLQRATDRPVGRLKVSAPLGLGERLIAPRLRGFLEDNPELLVDLDLSDRFVDMVAEGIDLSVRGGVLEDSSLVARRLCPLRLQIVASPELLQRRRVRTPSDLAKHDWILFSPMGERVRLTKGDAHAVVPVRGRVVTNHGGAHVEIVRSGLGLGIAPRFYVEEAVRAGELAVVLPRWKMPDAGVFAVWPSRKFTPLKVRVFVEHLVKELRTTAAKPRGTRRH